jgi:hypothetical protein
MRNFAQKAISLAPPITFSAVVLDSASGPGTVTGEILKNGSEEIPELCATDLVPAMIKIVQNKNWSNVHAESNGRPGSNLSRQSNSPTPSRISPS